MSYTIQSLEETVLAGLTNVDDRLSKLKDICDEMGIEFHHRHGEDKLKELIVAKFNNSPVEEESSESKEFAFKSLDRYPDESDNDYKTRKRHEAHKLVRVRITCMNPSKKELQGEIFSVGNEVIGTIKRYIPFNGNPTHVEAAFLGMLRERQFQQFKTVGKVGEAERKEGYLVNEFAIEFMPPLTKEELEAIAKKQMARGGADA